MNDQTLGVRASATPRSQTKETPVSESKFARGPGALVTTLLMARVTVREAARRKILWIAAIAGVAFLAFFAVGLSAMLHNMRAGTPDINRNEGLNLMTMMVLYAGSMLTCPMAILTSCDTLSGEIASGTIHAIATKPVRRWSLVLGKWLGFVIMVTFYVLLVEGGAIAVGRLIGHHLIPNPAAVLGLVWLQAVVLLGVTVAASSRFAALTSGAVSLGLYGLAFVGGWIEQYGAMQHVRTCINLGIFSSLLMPTDVLWRRAAFRMQPPILGAMGISPFSSSLVPSGAVVVYAAVYALIALLLAQLLFDRRDL